MGLVCGVEDAGRGPVIGPLVMAGVTIEEERENFLKEIGCKDSKLLSPERRSELAAKIKESCYWHAIIVPASEIDAALVSQKLNLNLLEALKSAEIINHLNPKKAILDCPSPNTEAYRIYVKKKVSCEVIAEHKADVNYPVVSAASIIAKTTRDAEIEKLKDEIGVDFGSGYVTDPKTAAFLDEHWETYPHLFRKKWGSYLARKRQKSQKGLGDF